MAAELFTPVTAGALRLRNRLVMAPMTRARADDATGDPGPLAALYYEQRAGAGLIITEGTAPSPMGKGQVRTPGIHRASHVYAWREVTRRVHAAGGLIVLQLMHCGRASHPDLLPNGARPIGPSAIRPNGQTLTENGLQDFVTPHALSTAEVAETVSEFGLATALAMDAGFDGVELHAGAGYLPEQFLCSSANRRDDGYGGTPRHRCRFIEETLEAMITAAGAGRVGLRLAPEMNAHDVIDTAPRDTYLQLVRRVARLKLAYLHVQVTGNGPDYHALLRPAFPGTYIMGAGLTRGPAAAAIREGRADATAFGSLFLANPDLPARFIGDLPLNRPDPATFYSGGERGYTDYPFLSPEESVTL